MRWRNVQTDVYGLRGVMNPMICNRLHSNDGSKKIWLCINYGATDRMWWHNYLRHNICKTTIENVDTSKLMIIQRCVTDIPSRSPELTLTDHNTGFRAWANNMTTQLPQTHSHGSVSLQWRHNGRDSVSNQQPYYCLVNRLFRRISKKTSKLRVIGLCVGNSPGPVNSPHKWSVTRKMFPFDDVIMILMKALLLGVNR